MNSRPLRSPFLGASFAALFVFACSDSPPAEGGAGGRTSGAGGTGGSQLAGSTSVAGVGGAGSTSAGSGGQGGEGGGGAGDNGAGAAGESGQAGRGGSGGSLGTGGSSGSGGTRDGGALLDAGRRDASGSAGSGGSGSSGDGGPSVGVVRSGGCDKPTTQAANQWVQSMVMAGTTSRATSVRLPSNYDPARAYPVIVLLHGCGGGTNNVPMENATGSDAILVRGTGSASGTCWETTANGADVAFFDAMVKDAKHRFCTDEKRFFVVGYSSGSWLANQLTCIRSEVLRGAATVTGGEAASGTCKGPVSRIFIHDSDDTTNVISGSVKARDRQLTQNGCDKSIQPTAHDPSPCMLYSGCPAAYPVMWCQTMGKEHGRQDSFAPTTFWNFFKSF